MHEQHIPTKILAEFNSPPKNLSGNLYLDTFQGIMLVMYVLLLRFVIAPKEERYDLTVN